MAARSNPIRSSMIALGVLTVAASGCGAIVDEASEKAVEEAVEKAVEDDTGEDVDIEFDDNGISIESDDGDFTLTADEDGVEIDGSDADGGEFSLDADENGIEVESDDGTVSLELDEDGGFTVTDEDGEVFSGEVDSDGDDVEFTVEGDDGEAVFSSAEGIPEQWPDDIPRPEALTEITGIYFAEGDDVNVIVNGTLDADLDLDDAFDTYASRLEDAGFVLDEETSFSADGARSALYQRGATWVTVSVQEADGSRGMVVAVA